MKQGRVVLHNKNEKYMVKSHLDAFVTAEVEESKRQGIRLTKGDVFERVADYAGISTNTIERLRRLGEPKLTTATMIAEYFNTTVDKIWEIKENPMWEDNRKKCKDCGRTHYVSGMCYRCWHMSKSKKKVKEKG